MYICQNCRAFCLLSNRQIRQKVLTTIPPPYMMQLEINLPPPPSHTPKKFPTPQYVSRMLHLTLPKCESRACVLGVPMWAERHLPTYWKALLWISETVARSGGRGGGVRGDEGGRAACNQQCHFCHDHWMVRTHRHRHAQCPNVYTHICVCLRTWLVLLQCCALIKQQHSKQLLV